MLKKNFLLVSCAVVSFVHAETTSKEACNNRAAAKPVEVAITQGDLKQASNIADEFQKLETEFKKWGVSTVWDQVRGKNSNVAGGQATDTVAYGMFANAKHPLFAVTGGKFVSADPKLDGQDATGAEHIKKIQAALKESKDGKVTIEYTRMAKNPADNDGPMVGVNVKAIAWNQRAFDMQDHEFFVYRELIG